MPGNRLRHFHFDTDGIPEREQFAAWRDTMAGTAEILPAGEEQGPYRASVDVWPLPALAVTVGLLDAQRTHRSRKRAQRDPDHYFLTTHLAGRTIARLGHRDIAFGIGQPILFDLGRPVDFEVTSSSSVSFMVPREELDALVPAFDRHGLALAPGLGSLAHDYLVALAQRLPQLSAADATGAARASLGLISACLSPSPDWVEQARAPLEEALLLRARRYIDANLHSPTLTPVVIGRAIGLSRSSLYRLFEPEGGVAAFVRTRRLERVHALISDASERRPLADIAYDYGFHNERSFRRSFQRHFGFSPKEARGEASADRALPQPVPGEWRVSDILPLRSPLKAECTGR